MHNVVFAPCFESDSRNEHRDLIVVRRPALRSYTGRTMGHVDERLAIVIERYDAAGPTECIGVDENGPIYGSKRVPVRSEVVWCSRDERELYDLATGGRPTEPRAETTGPAERYLPADGARVQAAIARLQVG